MEVLEKQKLLVVIPSWRSLFQMAAFDTEKYVDCWSSSVVVDFLPGPAAGNKFRGPLRGDDLKKQGWIWASPTSVANILDFVASSEHGHKYCTRDFNCHHYAQDLWNYCVIFSHRVWWRPDMIKAKLLGGSILCRQRVGFEEDQDYDDLDWDEDYPDDHF